MALNEYVFKDFELFQAHNDKQHGALGEQGLKESQKFPSSTSDRSAAFAQLDPCWTTGNSRRTRADEWYERSARRGFA